MTETIKSIEELSLTDLENRISTLQERLVSFYAIQSDLECDEAKDVLQVQINNYIYSLKLLQAELNKRRI